MSDEMDDFQDFIDVTDKELQQILKESRRQDMVCDTPICPNSSNIGELSQYSLYSTGYLPTNNTVKSLPPGVYDINVGERGEWANPINVKEGLLVELPEMRSDHVIKLVEKFWEAEKDYKEGNDYVQGGSTYKMGIMLYGPAGSGKSCTIKLLMRKIVDKGGIVFLANGVSAHYVSTFLKQFSNIEPNRKTIVVFEDFDSLVEKFGEGEYLQLLDGNKSIDNVLFIATTNYPEKLDPRIYNRPGRFTHVIKIGLPTKLAREAYLRAVLKRHDNIEQILNLTDNFSIDHLSALVNAVYREGKDIIKESERLRKLFKVPTAGESRSMGLSIES